MNKIVNISLLILLIIFLLFMLNKYLINNLYEKFDNSNYENEYSKMYKIITEEELNNMEFDENLKNEYTDYFTVQEIVNPINNLSKAISVSLFCQNVDSKYEGEFEAPDHNDVNSKWYNKYYKNLLKLVNDKKSLLPKYKLRIYLENKLQGLKNNLINDNTEIYIMKHNSIGAQPGMLWRFMAFDDKSLDVVFAIDIDEDFGNNLKYINAFDKSNKTFGRFMSSYNYDFKINNKLSDSPLNYTVVIGSKVGVRPKQSNISFVNNFILLMLLINNRYNSEKRWGFDDNEEMTPYNKPINETNICWGCNPFIYGFDEKVFKHLFFPYFVKKGECLTMTHNNIDKMKKLNKNKPTKIDYDFTMSYNNEFVQI